MARFPNAIIQVLSRMRISSFLNTLIAVTYLALAILVITTTSVRIRQYAMHEAESKASLIINRNLALHTYFNATLKPALFLLTDTYRSAEYFNPVWMSSTYAVREIDALFQRSDDYNSYYYREAAINARSPQNEADPFEKAFLEQINHDPNIQKSSRVRLIDGMPFLEVMLRGEVMEEACLRCHSTPERAPAEMVSLYGSERSFNRSVGEVVSAISIRIPLAVAYEQANLDTQEIAALILLMLFGLYLAQRTLMNHMVLKPLNMLHGKALQIAENEQYLGEQIALPFGAELKDLASAFNKLSRNLRSSKDLLESRIDERTHELARSQHLIQHILDLTPSPLCLLDVGKNSFVYANQQILSFFGVTETLFKQFDGRYVGDHIHPDDLHVFKELRARLNYSQENQVIEARLRIQNREQEWRWVSLRSLVIERQPDGQPSLLLFIGDDITEAHLAEERLRYTSTHDALTGLYNWAFLEDTIENWSGSRRSLNANPSPFPVGIMMMDVDNLKIINDSLGHRQGDELLRQVGSRLMKVFRDGDIVARVGGDEFAALLPNVSEQDLEMIHQRVQNRLCDIPVMDGQGKNILSVGLAIAYGPEDLSDARHQADQNMYTNKQLRKQETASNIHRKN